MMISHTILLSGLLTLCMVGSHPFPLAEWYTSELTPSADPLTYPIRLQNVNTEYPTFKTKRNIIREFEIRESLLTALIKEVDSSHILAKRLKRTLENDTSGARMARNNNLFHVGGPKDQNLKANLRFHHQQRHPNGSITGSYAQMDPNGQLQITHYVNDGKGLKEFPDTGNVDLYQHSPSGQVNILVSSNPSNISLQPNQNRQGIPGIIPLDGAGGNYITNVPSPYTTSLRESMKSSSIQNSEPKSPLFDKYYRHTPHEAQRAYEYHKIRTFFDSNPHRPPEGVINPDTARDKHPEVHSMYREYQVPYQAQFRDEGSVYAHPTSDPTPYPSLMPLSGPVPQQIFYLPQSPYPQTLPPQAPIYLRSYEGQTFVPASTYSGPYLPNTATFNQPYPTNIPIYESPVPQNVPTFSHPPPQNINAYQPSPVAAAPGYGPQQQVYYASASNPHPTTISKL